MAQESKPWNQQPRGSWIRPAQPMHIVALALPAGGAWGKGLQWPPDILAQGRNSGLVALGVERKALQAGLAGSVRGWQDG